MFYAVACNLYSFLGALPLTTYQSQVELNRKGFNHSLFVQFSFANQKYPSQEIISTKPRVPGFRYSKYRKSKIGDTPNNLNKKWNI